MCQCGSFFGVHLAKAIVQGLCAILLIVLMASPSSWVGRSGYNAGVFYAEDGNIFDVLSCLDLDGAIRAAQTFSIIGLLLTISSGICCIVMLVVGETYRKSLLGVSLALDILALLIFGAFVITTIVVVNHDCYVPGYNFSPYRSYNYSYTAVEPEYGFYFVIFCLITAVCWIISDSIFLCCIPQGDTQNTTVTVAHTAGVVNTAGVYHVVPQQNGAFAPYMGYPMHPQHVAQPQPQPQQQYMPPSVEMTSNVVSTAE